GPNVQFEERVQAEAVWRGDQLESLAIELRWSIVVVLEVGGRVHDVFDADQPKFAPDGLINQSFGILLFNFVILYQRDVNVVAANGAVVRPADAAKSRPVPGGAGIVHVYELASGVANVFHQLGGCVVFLMGGVLRKKRNDGGGQEHQTNIEDCDGTYAACC